MKFCEECGAQLEDDVMFCDECGTPVSEDVTEAVVVLPEINSEVEPQELSKPKKKLNPKLFIGIGAGIVVVALIVVVVILAIKLVQKNDEGIPLVGDDETTSYEVAEKETTIEDVTTEEPTTEEPTTEEPTTEEVTTEELTTEEPTTEEPTTNSSVNYVFFEEFIALCNQLQLLEYYEDPIELEAYQKRMYESWLNGEVLTSIHVGLDGALYYDIFNNAPYGAFTTEFSFNGNDYGFRLLKHNGDYEAQFVEVVDSNRYDYYFNMYDVGLEKANYATSIVMGDSTNIVNVMFTLHNDGSCYLYVDNDYYVIVDANISYDYSSYKELYSEEEFYDWLYS